MPYGIKIWNPDAELLIDGESTTMLLWYETDVTIDLSVKKKEDVIYPALANKPMILVSPLSHRLFFTYRPWKSNTNWDRVEIGAYKETPDVVTLRVFVFAHKEGESADLYGIKIYNSNSEILFDGGRKFLRIHAEYSGSLVDGQVKTFWFPELGYVPPINMGTREATFYHDGTCGLYCFKSILVRVYTNAIELSNETVAVGGPAAKYGCPASATLDYAVSIFAYE